MISLAYWAISILTSPRPTYDVSSVHAASERKAKPRRYGWYLSYGTPILNAGEEPLPAPNIVDAVLQETPRVEGHPLLFNYLKQLNPTDKKELQFVLNVAAEARVQVLADQAATLNAMDHAKQRISSARS